MQIFRLEWEWDGTWMELRRESCDLDAGEREPLWSEMQISWPGSSFGVIWIEVKHKYRHLGGAEMGPGLSWGAHHETWIRWDGARMELGCNFLTWMDVGCKKSGHVLRWNMVSMEEETWCRWLQDLDGIEMHIPRPGCVWDWTWMELRWIFRTWMEMRRHLDGC